MVIHNFDELIARQKGHGAVVRMAVAAAEDTHTLEAALRARQEGLVRPILTGDPAGIRAALEELGATVPEEDIICAEDPAEAARRAVSLVREGRADFILKGKLDTSLLLRPVVDKSTGLGNGGVMSHIAALEIPGYHKLLFVTDGGMLPYPTLDQKAALIRNAAETLHTLGYDTIKVGVLACIEKVNPKMPETVEADALKEMGLHGEFPGCVVEGPISIDCAVNSETAAFKGFDSPCAGDCDLLLVPNIHTGNIFVKALTEFAGAKFAGFVVGARCPIAMVSRGSSPEEKYLSIVAAGASARNR